MTGKAQYKQLRNMNVKPQKSDFPLIFHRRSNDVGIKCLSLSLCAFYAEDSLFEENRIGAIHILWFYETELIIFRFTFLM